MERILDEFSGPVVTFQDIPIAFWVRFETQNVGYNAWDHLTVTLSELYLGMKIHSSSYYLSSEHFGLLPHLRNVVFFPSSGLCIFCSLCLDCSSIPTSCPSTPPSSSFTQLTDFSFSASCEGRPSPTAHPPPSQGQVPVPYAISYSTPWFSFIACLSQFMDLFTAFLPS